MADRNETDNRAGRRDSGVASNPEDSTEDFKKKYNELNSQIDNILTETMKRSNRIFMESELGHLVTNLVFNASNDGIWAIDRNHKIIRANKKLLRLFNKKAEDVFGILCKDFFPGGCPMEDMCPWKNIEKGEPIVAQEKTLVLPSGERCVFRVAFTPLADLDGNTIGLVETFTDITERKQAEEALQRANRELEIMAREDSLTKLANRRKFDEYLEVEWRRQKRAQKPVSLIMCDVDHFKNYNDAYGHPAGDACLAKIAHVIRQSLHRVSDMGARYGGEEFAVIMPETDIDGARIVAERIRNGLKELGIPHSRSDAAPYVTVSYGVASMIPRDDLQPWTLIETADRRLYLAKQKGRDRIVADDE
ncbi:MAG: diguanylate cyclase [Acidobacteria bacterium]|nr:diguanylate cyclase [Acidobacteriota bacterium]